MKILNRDIKLAIFDLDGTLLDSTHIWHEIDKDFFARRNMQLPPNYFLEICHLGLLGTAKYTKEKYGIKETEEEMIKEWQDASTNYYHNVLQLKPHAKEFLKYLKDNGVSIALATVNDEPLYKPCLQRLGVYDYFDFFMDVNKAKIGKESPKLYHSINDRFGIKVENTMVLEDIALGLRTAHNNGYLTIAVDDNASKYTVEEKKENSDYYIYDFAELIK